MDIKKQADFLAWKQTLITEVIGGIIMFHSPNGTLLYEVDLFEYYNQTIIENKKTDEDDLNGIFADRYNKGKIKWSLVDFESLEDMVRVLEFGAKKYAPNNWKKGLHTTEIIDSLLRHLFAYQRGEENDQESGISHIGHVLCNAMFLAHMMKFKPEMDDRNAK